MTQIKDRKNAIRSLADALGVPYSAAARKLDSARCAPRSPDSGPTAAGTFSLLNDRVAISSGALREL